MKVSIVTFHSAYNYGAILQAYALQSYLNENFGATSILDYHNEHIDKSYRMPQLSDFTSNPKNAVFRISQAILYRGKNKKIDKFCKENLCLTKRYSRENINAAQNEADVFIVGSDQVWNYLIVDRDRTFYLDFAQNKTTCSYAASFGVDHVPDNYIDFYNTQLNKIDFISVREEQGVGLVKKLSNKEAISMPDPTLLLEQRIWNEMCITPDFKSPYILVYKITKADKLIEFAKMLSSKTGFQIIYVPNDLKSGSIGSLKLNVGPQEWLGYIRNAEYVVTNSFHGTVFSIVFGKRFFTEISNKVNSTTSRLRSLLETFDLTNRTIDKFNDSMIGIGFSKDKIQNVLENQRLKAYNYFERVFNGVEL